MICLTVCLFHLRKQIPSELAATDETYSLSQGKCQDLKTERQVMPRSMQDSSIAQPHSKKLTFSIRRHSPKWKLVMRTK